MSFFCRLLVIRYNLDRLNDKYMKEILKLGKLLLILLIAIPFLVVAGAVGIFIFCTQSNGQPYYLTD